jgi:mono/diheme cytochrome c family protein
MRGRGMEKIKDPLTPVEAALRRRAIRIWVMVVVVAAILAILAILAAQRYAPNRPAVYEDVTEHFKYGSIGADVENGLPLRILQALPRMFPDYLPQGGPRDYRAFGFLQEPGRPMPIGFSVRRRYIDLVGLNCAVCHVGEVRASAQDKPRVILGMPANIVDLQAFFEFLMACAADNRFTADRIIAEIEKDGDLYLPDRLLYRLAVPQVQAGLLKLKARLASYMFPDHPKFWPGRVDTFNPYKIIQFSEYYPPASISDEERIGTVDFPSIWNQRPREGLNLHWDGNNSSVRERNFSAAFGAGATPQTVDSAAFDRVTAWLADLQPPSYPFGVTPDRSVLARGEATYRQRCHACHAFGDKLIGQVDDIDSIGTDRHRLDSYTAKLADVQRHWGEGYDWAFRHFRKTNGYANVPLDGIWARAPYLHNGSVPSLWDLLTPEGERNDKRDFFYRGHSVYDPEKVGFRTDVEEMDGRKSFRFFISQPGNSNRGHSGARYGTDLSDQDKRALLEYLKTL